MAFPTSTRDKLRKIYVYGQLSLEISAMQLGVTFGTARRWKAAAKADGDDWEKSKAAYIMSGGSIEEIGREILNGFLIQYRTAIDELTTAELDAKEKVQLLASLSDSYVKTTAASKKILPETSELATAMQVVSMQVDYIQAHHPESLEAFINILDGFGEELAKKYGG